MRVDGIAAAIAPVDVLVGVEKEGEPGDVVIEIEQVQVHAGDPDQPDANEFVGRDRDFLVEERLTCSSNCPHSPQGSQRKTTNIGLPVRFASALAAL